MHHVKKYSRKRYSKIVVTMNCFVFDQCKNNLDSDCFETLFRALILMLLYKNKKRVYDFKFMTLVITARKIRVI